MCQMLERAILRDRQDMDIAYYLLAPNIIILSTMSGVMGISPYHISYSYETRSPPMVVLKCSISHLNCSNILAVTS